MRRKCEKLLIEVDIAFLECVRYTITPPSIHQRGGRLDVSHVIRKRYNVSQLREIQTIVGAQHCCAPTRIPDSNDKRYIWMKDRVLRVGKGVQYLRFRR